MQSSLLNFNGTLTNVYKVVDIVHLLKEIKGWVVIHCTCIS